MGILKSASTELFDFRIIVNHSARNHKCTSHIGTCVLNNNRIAFKS